MRAYIPTPACTLYTLSEQKQGLLVLGITSAAMMTDLRHYFTFELSSKFATNVLSCFQLHLKRVAALPCEIQKKIKNAQVCGPTIYEALIRTCQH